MLVFLRGYSVDFNACVQLMDDEIREKLNRKIGGCTEQEFLDTYCEEHEEKYGEEFKV